MGLARAANIPVVVVGDIDRGGVLAHLFGTVAVSRPRGSALIAGFIINKFRGDPALLAPGLEQLGSAHRPAHLRRAALQRRAVAGRRGFAVGACRGGRRRARRTARQPGAAGGGGTAAADLQFHRRRGARLRARGGGPLGHRSGRARRRRHRGDPRQQGHRRRPGLAATARTGARRSPAHAAAGRVVLGVCGGFQMLCRRIDDPRGEWTRRGGRTRSARRRHRLRHRQDTCGAGTARCAATRSTTAG